MRHDAPRREVCRLWVISKASGLTDASYQNQRQQLCQQFVVRQIRRPAVGGEDGFIQLAMNVRQPGGAFGVFCFYAESVTAPSPGSPLRRTLGIREPEESTLKGSENAGGA